MNPITICPSTLAEGYDSYSPIAIKHLFDGRQVSPFWIIHPLMTTTIPQPKKSFCTIRSESRCREYNPNIR